MSRLESFLENASDTRLMELFQILDDEETGDVDDVYKDMLLARKIMLSKYNRLNIIGVTIRSVYYYNNKSKRYGNYNAIDKKLQMRVKQIIEKSDKPNMIMPLRYINSPICLFHKVFCCICQNKIYNGLI